VNTKGSATQNQLEANINSKTRPTREIRNKIQYIPLEVVFVFSIMLVFFGKVKVYIGNAKLYLYICKKIEMSLISILRNSLKMKCPKCREGDLFESPTLGFNNKSFDMPEKCPVCEQSYMPEPGFYYGAMFLSYILTGFFCILFMFGVHWGIGLTLTKSFLILITILVIAFPFVFRISRSLWLNMMEKYDPNWKKS